MQGLVLIRSEADCAAWARRWGLALEQWIRVRGWGWRIFLEGDLGAGKTMFTKALCAALGVVDAVTSPTFTLMHEYRGRTLNVCHADVYRLERTAEFDDLDLDGARAAGNVLVIEWGEVLSDAFPDHLALRFAHADDANQRSITLAAHGSGWQSRLERIAAHLGTTVAP